MVLLVAMPMPPTFSITTLHIRAVGIMTPHHEKDLGHDGVGYEVQKRVPKQTTTSERKEDLQKPLFFLTVVQGDEEQNEEWSCRDEEGCHDRVEPDRGARSFVILFIPVGVKFLPVHLSLLGTWFSLGWAMRVTMTTMGMTMTPMGMGMVMSMVSMCVSMMVVLLLLFIFHSMGMTMTNYGFIVNALLIKSWIFFRSLVSCLGPLEGRVGVAMTVSMIMCVAMAVVMCMSVITREHLRISVKSTLGNITFQALKALTKGRRTRTERMAHVWRAMVAPGDHLSETGLNESSFIDFM